MHGVKENITQIVSWIEESQNLFIKTFYWAVVTVSTEQSEESAEVETKTPKTSLLKQNFDKRYIDVNLKNNLKQLEKKKKKHLSNKFEADQLTEYSYLTQYLNLSG